MKIVKVSTRFPDWPLLRQTPNEEGFWAGYKFVVNQPIEECDYWVVYEGMDKPETVICNPANTLFISAEPPAVKKYNDNFLSQFSKIISSHTTIKHSGLTLSQQSLMWMVGGKYKNGKWGNFSKNYDELSKTEIYKKNKLISVVLSKKDQTEGHKKKNQFVLALKKYFGDDLDVFGVGINELEDKWDAISGYKYHLVLENSSVDDYWTEKLSDSYLGGAYPFYYGCPNLENYFSSAAFTRIDIDDPEESIKIIEHEIKSGRYHDSSEELRNAKKLVLDKYNLFPMLSDFFDKNPSDNSKKKIMILDENTSRELSIKKYKKMLRFIKTSLMNNFAKKVHNKYIQTLRVTEKLINENIPRVQSSKYKKSSYSQGGEDLLVQFIFSVLNIDNPTYLDIGAHHPFYLSNTSLMYKNGSRGVCIEPDPLLFKLIEKYRQEDICLNIGIGLDNSDEADFYLMDVPTLNTFSREEAINYQNKSSHKIEDVIKVPLKNINLIIETNFDKTPDFLNIDVEGLDFEIIKSLDFNRFRPTVICVETLKFVRTGVEIKDVKLIEFIKEKGYLIYADTYMNTIFVDMYKWSERADI